MCFTCSLTITTRKNDRWTVKINRLGNADTAGALFNMLLLLSLPYENYLLIEGTYILCIVAVVLDKTKVDDRYLWNL